MTAGTARPCRHTDVFKLSLPAPCDGLRLSYIEVRKARGLVRILGERWDRLGRA
jgi:hypothetical protein